jgi:hypothetical protein
MSTIMSAARVGSEWGRGNGICDCSSGRVGELTKRVLLQLKPQMEGKGSERGSSSSRLLRVSSLMCGGQRLPFSHGGANRFPKVLPCLSLAFEPGPLAPLALCPYAASQRLAVLTCALRKSFESPDTMCARGPLVPLYPN